MALMSDTLKRGITFEGVSGLKTGANLEDLLTRSHFVSGSQLLDQSSIEDFADPALVDDYGAALRRARVKAGGITGAMLSNSAIFGPSLMTTIFGSAALATAGANIVGGWTVAPATMDNIFDGAVGTDWGNATLNVGGTASVGYWWDLGAVYQGHIFVVGTNASSSSNSALINFGYSENPPTSGYTYGGSTSGSAVEKTGLVPFIGQYVGMGWSVSGSNTMVVQRFDVFGRTLA